jgi:hypothetical protein
MVPAIAPENNKKDRVAAQHLAPSWTGGPPTNQLAKTGKTRKKEQTEKFISLPLATWNRRITPKLALANANE